MKPIGHHIVLRLADSRVIATSAAARRAASRAILSVGRDLGVFVFRVVDNHVHIAALGDRRQAGELARRVSIALRRILRIDVPFAPATYRAIENQHHLVRVVHYILSQEDHHGCPIDPLHDGSCLPELLGLRVGADWIRSRLRELAPRIRDGQVLTYLPKRAALDETSRAELVESAAAAIGRELHGRGDEIVEARRAAAHAAVSHRIADASTVAALLGIHPSSVRRLLRRPARPDLLRAVTRQLQHRAGLRRASRASA